MSGCAYSWGESGEGVLGFPNTVNGVNDSQFVDKPRLISSKSFRKISSGMFHVLALTDKRELFSWGRSINGRLGHSHDVDYISTPTQINFGDNDKEIKFKEIDCGYHHSLAISVDGDIYSWGSGYSGQCGTGGRIDLLNPHKIVIDNDNKVRFTKIAAGYYHSLALDADGHIWIWGTGREGQLGLGSEVIFRPKPKKMEFDQGIVFSFIAASEYNSAAISTTGELYMWGSNRYGQLGNGTQDIDLEYICWLPRLVKLSTSLSWKFVTLGGFHSIALTSTGKLYFWGRSLTDPLASFLQPTLLPKLDVFNFVSVSCRWYHALGLTEDNKIVGWGVGEYGQLGDGELKTFSHTLPAVIAPPVLKEGKESENTFLGVATGAYHSFALIGSKELVRKEKSRKSGKKISSKNIPISPRNPKYIRQQLDLLSQREKTLKEEESRIKQELDQIQEKKKELLAQISV